MFGTSALSGQTAVAVSAGAEHSLALCADGTVVAWGDNTAGELGDNSETASSVPVAVSMAPLAARERFVQVSSGSAAYHSFALGALPPTVELTGLTLSAGTGKPVEGAGVSGSGIPAGAKWRLVGLPGQDAAADALTGGAAVFRGTFSSPGGGVQAGIFGLGGGTPLLAKTGDVAPGTGGKRFAVLGEPVGNGGTAFYGSLVGVGATSARGLWANAFPDAAEQLQLVARTGGAVPGLPSARYTSLAGLALNAGQHLFWSGTFAGLGVRPGTETALFEMSSVAAGPQLMLRTGQQVTIEGRPAIVRSFVAPEALNANFGAGLPGTMAGYNTGRLDGGAMVPVRLVLADGRIALAALSAGAPITPLAVTRGMVPGIHGALWSTLSYPVAAPSGLMAFRGTLAVAPGFHGTVPAGTAQVIFTQALDKDGAILPPALLARQGMAAPDLPGLKFAGFSDPYLNRLGDVLFFSLLSGPGVTMGNRLALYWQPAGEATASLVARTGAIAPGSPTPRSSALPYAFGQPHLPLRMRS